MKITQLLKEWEAQAADAMTLKEYVLRLPLYDAARLSALAEMFPGRTEQQIITELLTVVLDELGEAMPYIQGTKIIGEDECGDPIYEDAGLTPRYSTLTQKFLKIHAKDLKDSQA
ncbi:hypothetical protein [Beggiatoa leptomitoformis]|uniref:Type 1 pili tip component n=1 Tax=Beggiatoa leptomitoformis TaxID=288004 RepID=A0A2N9YJI6_9GAMM|nr:hypothetical protein [Beggiatoa leptomitoformis]ALG67385.1 type 1 pili tip component [Beggiatoa leptomitoformis]AUI70406.1 type 1 pili tip component [Beggiatoa leptomitoformis]